MEDGIPLLGVELDLVTSFDMKKRVQQFSLGEWFGAFSQQLLDFLSRIHFSTVKHKRKKLVLFCHQKSCLDCFIDRAFDLCLVDGEQFSRPAREFFSLQKTMSGSPACVVENEPDPRLEAVRAFRFNSHSLCNRVCNLKTDPLNVVD